MSMPEMIDSLNHMSKHDQLIRIVTLNPQMVIESDRNPDLKHWLQSADLIVPDGQGIVLASKVPPVLERPPWQKKDWHTV